MAISEVLTDFNCVNTSAEIRRVHLDLTGVMSSLKHIGDELDEQITFLEDEDDQDIGKN